MLTEGGDELEQFVGHPGLGDAGTGPGGRDLLDLVDEQHQFVEFVEVTEGLAQGCRQPAR